MKNIVMMAMICIIAVSCTRAIVPSATPYANQEIKNEQGNTILAGHCSLSILNNAPYREWFYKAYNAYHPDTSTITQLASLTGNTTIEIFLGSWCGDSKREVPRMIKILQAASFDTTRLHLIFTDNGTARYKQSPQREEYGKNIHRVPTFIFYTNNKETGRIVEYPVTSLEKDMVAILQGSSYQPNYPSIPYWQQHVKHSNRPMTDTALQLFTDGVKPLCKDARDFNAYGYMLLAQKNYTEALNVFRLNTRLYPEKASVYDSLGEAFYITGDKKNARLNYEKALALKPGDADIIKMLDKLK